LRLVAPDGERTIDAADLAVSPFMTTLGARELVTEIAIPVPPTGSGSAYVTVEHPASGFALAGAAALVAADGTTQVALTGVAATPFLLEGDVADAELFGDRFAPVEYRRHLARTVVGRAVEIAKARAEEDTTWTP
jgi:carbon-monoxide dehydrogenase medium subunit